jgi:Dickkopf N-terminal cysteine-rich region
MKRAAVGMLACALGGCGPSSLADFREQYLDRRCAHDVKCGVVGASETPTCGLPGDFAIAVPGALDVPAAIDAGRMRFNSSGAQECLDAVSSAPCDRDGMLARLARHCSNVVQARVRPGGTCFGHAECLGGICALGNGCPGQCVAWPAPGEACGGGCDPSVEYCGVPMGGSAAVCLTRKPAGATCAGDEECVFDLLCIAQKCAERWQPTGAACGGTTRPCGDGLACVAGVCAPFVQENAMCTNASVCMPGSACAGGTCKPWRDVGQTCGQDDGLCPASQSCGATCSSVHQPRAHFHDACDVMACAPGLVCDSFHECSYPAGIGGKCADTVECATGLTCDPMLSQCVGLYGTCAP